MAIIKTFDSPAKLLTQDFYQYELYSEYIKNLNYYILNSKKSGVVIKLLHFNVEKSKNKDDDSNIHGINRASNNIYDVYEFCPTLDTSALMYQIGRNDSRLGFDINSSQTLTIFQMSEPLPEDLFTFYSNQKEIFRITQVNYIQTVHENLKIYQIMYENAPITQKTFDGLNILDTFYFNNEFDIWYKAEFYQNFVEIVQNKDTWVKTIKNYYDPINCYYKDSVIPDDQIKLCNQTIHVLKILGKINLPPLLNYKYEIDQYDLPIILEDQDIYVDDPNYVNQNPSATDIEDYSPYTGKYAHPLLESTYNLIINYLPFIYISIGKDPHIDEYYYK